MIIIDGGKGQLSSALSELEKLGARIPIISIAKRLEEIFVPGKAESLPLKSTGQSVTFIRQIRDEAHRFAVKYHHVRRRKELIS